MVGSHTKKIKKISKPVQSTMRSISSDVRPILQTGFEPANKSKESLWNSSKQQLKNLRKKVSKSADNKETPVKKLQNKIVAKAKKSQASKKSQKAQPEQLLSYPRINSPNIPLAIQSRQDDSNELSLFTKTDNVRIIPLSELSEIAEYGSGNFGTTYTARLNSLPVVIKVPKRKIGNDEWNEFKTFLNVPGHPNVVKFVGLCLDFSTDDQKGTSSLSFVTRFVSRGSLKNLVLGLSSEQDIHSFYEPRQLLKLCLDVAKGVGHLHEHGVIHSYILTKPLLRDIAARNVLVSDEYSYILSDFGLSRSVSTDQGSYYRMDSQNMLPIRWMAPESLCYHHFTTKSDVWMYGIFLWELSTLCSSRPYTDVDNPNEMMIRVFNGSLRVKPGSSHIAFFPPLLNSFIAQCTAISEDDRPSISTIIGQLHATLQNQTVLDELTNEWSTQKPSVLIDFDMQQIAMQPASNMSILTSNEMPQFLEDDLNRSLSQVSEDGYQHSLDRQSIIRDNVLAQYDP